MKVRRLPAVLGLIIAAALAVAGPPSATARSAASSTPSPYLAGYTSTVKGSGSISRLTVPEFSCPQGFDTRVAFGIADQGPSEPQPVVRVAIDAICDVEGGPAEYGIEVVVPGQSLVSSFVSAGDVLSFRVSYGKNHQVVASVINRTDPRGSISLTGVSPKAALHFGALPLVEGDDFLLPAPDFGQVDVVKAVAAGTPLASQTAIRYHRVNDGQTVIRASRLADKASKPGSFSLVFGDTRVQG